MQYHLWARESVVGSGGTNADGMTVLLMTSICTDVGNMYGTGLFPTTTFA